MPRKSSLKAIEARIRELEAKAEALKRIEKPGIKQLKAVLFRFQLTMADVELAMSGSGTKRSAASKLKGRTVKPKYRNPGNKSETWAGRGLRPKWMAALLKQGKKLQDLAI